MLICFFQNMVACDTLRVFGFIFSIILGVLRNYYIIHIIKINKIFTVKDI